MAGYKMIPSQEVDTPPYIQLTETQTDRQQSVDSILSSGKRDRKRERHNTKIIDCVLEGNKDGLKKLLEAGYSPNATCRDFSITALHIAAFNGKTEILELLLEHKADPKRRTREGLQPSHLAALKGHFACLKELCNHDKTLVTSKIEKKPATETPPEDLDSWSHSHENISSLSQEFCEGSTAAHLAARNSHSKCLGYLAKQDGTALTVEDQNGMSPMDILREVGGYLCPVKEKEPERTMKVSNKAPETVEGGLTFKPRMLSRAKPSATKFAGGPGETKSSFEGEVSMYQLIDEHCTGGNEEKLFTAIAAKDTEMTNKLLEDPLDLKAKKKGMTLLHWAFKVEDFKTMEKLILKDSSIVNLADDKGKTCLHHAVKKGCKNAVSLLLENDAQIDITYKEGKTIFHTVVKKGHVIILRELLSYVYDCGPFKQNKQLDSVYKQFTAIMLAAKLNRKECVEMLLKEGASVRHTDNEKNNIFHICAKFGSTECIEVLLNSKSSVPYTELEGLLTARNEDDYTPLHISAERNNPKITDLLSEKAKEKNLPMEKLHRTYQPLHLAAWHGNKDCVKILLKNNGDLSAKDKEYRSVLDSIALGIPDPSEFMESVFDSFIEKNDFPTSDTKCEIKVKFNLLIPKNEKSRQMTVLLSLLNVRRRNLKNTLLLHPIVEAFLYLKWEKLKLFFWVLMLLYLFFVGSITAVNFCDIVYEDNCPSRTVFHSLLVLSFVLTFVLELMNLKQLNLYYLRDPENWAKLAMFCLSFLKIISFYSTSSMFLRALDLVAPILVLSAWVQLLLFLGRNPTWGYYIAMFTKVAYNLFKVMASFVLLLLGFSFAFMIYEKTELKDVLEEAVKIIVMTVEVGYHEVSKDYDWVGRNLMVSFVLLVAMTLNNLTGALAVTDVAQLEAEGYASRFSKQVDFFNLIEVSLLNFSSVCGTVCGTMFDKVLSYFEVEEFITICPSAPRTKQSVKLPVFIKESIIEKVNAKDNKSLEEKLERITKDLESMKESIKEISNSKSAEIQKKLE